MTVKTDVIRQLSAGGMIALCLGASAEAKAPRYDRHAAADNAAAATAALEERVKALTDQMAALQAWHDAEASDAGRAKAQIAAMQAQLTEAEARAQAAQSKVDTQIETIPGAIKSEVAAASPRTDRMTYKGLTITPGGFLAMESVYRGRQEGADIGSTFSGIPLPNVATSHSQETRFTARQSRLSLLAQGDVGPSIHLGGYYEMDFLGAAQTANSNESNSFTPRIRALYSTVDWDQPFGAVHLLAGQNWSLATMNTKGEAPRAENVPLTIEAQYVVGFVWARQPQVRLTTSLTNGLSFGASLENPQTTLYNSGKFSAGVTAPITGIAAGSLFNAANTLSLNKYPDVIGKLAFDKEIEGHALHIEAFGILRDFYAQVSSAGVPGGQDVTGGGVGGGAILTAVPKVLDLQVSGLAGRGVGRYASGQLPDVGFGVDGRIHPVQEYAVMGGGTLHVGSSLDVYIYGGEERESAQGYAGLNGATTVFNGVGNPSYDNTGCETYGNTANCVGNTHFLDQITAGFWQRPYVGKFGKLQWGIEYSYTERHAFPGFGVSPIIGGNPAPVARENMIFTSLRYYPF